MGKSVCVYVRVGIGRKTDVDAGIRDGRKGSTERQTDRQTDSTLYRTGR